MIDTWMHWPIWARIASGIAVIVVVDAAVMAWPERDFFSGFLSSVLAILLYWGRVAAALAAGIWVGTTVLRRTNSTWLAWTTGIPVGLAAGFVVSLMADQIPSVRWRMDAMESSDCYTDWDGRSNPVVCE